MFTSRIATMTALALIGSLPVAAIIINTGSDPNLLNVGYNGIVHGVNLSGVVKVTSSGGLCSGSLLSDGTSILTAAHCVSDLPTSPFFTGFSVDFLGPSGFISAAVANVTIDPLWNGTVNNGGDLAVLHLTDAAPVFATRYSLFFGTPNLTTSVNVLAGYGYGGTGATGYDSGTYPFGTLRAGTNKYITTGIPVGDSSAMLLGEVYKPGDPSTNTLHASTPYVNNIDAVGIAPGDSGGPTFQDGLLVGVHDSIDCLLRGADPNVCGSPNPNLNESFGQFFEDTSVSANITWITQQETVAGPEGGTMGLMMVGGAMLALWRRNPGAFAQVKRLISRRIGPPLNGA